MRETSNHRFVSGQVIRVTNLLLLLLMVTALVGCGGGAEDAVKPKDQNRFGSNSSPSSETSSVIITFSDLDPITANEGDIITPLTNPAISALSCSTDEDISDLEKVPSYSLTQTNSYAGCSIASISGASAVKCDIDYKPGDSTWSSEIFVHCDINGHTATKSFALTVNHTNRPPVLDSAASQTLYVETDITPVDIDDGGDDLDADSDTITYSCTFEGNGNAAGTACSASNLPSLVYDFSTSNGTLVWKPSIAAGTDDGSDNPYVFTITGTDPDGATDTVTFTITVQSIAPPVFVSIDPDTSSTPSTTVTAPTIKGTTDADVSTVYFYRDSDCTDYITSGTKANFEGGGITLGLSPNTVTTIYAVAQDSTNRKSGCTYMTDYEHDSLSPGDPVFVSTNPASPSNTSQTPAVIGTASASTVTVNLYSDSNCSNSLGSGTKAEFEGAGITTSTLAANDVSAIYAQSVDSIPADSNCTLMINYRHDDINPGTVTLSDGPVTYNSSNTSTPSLSWNSATDSGSGISYYEVSVGSSAGLTDIVSWTNVGNVNETILAGTFTNGTTYYPNIRAVDYAGNKATVTSGDGWTVETSGPTGLSFIGASCGRFSSGDNFTIMANWNAASDPESGITATDYAIGTSSGGTELVDWTSAGGSSSFSTNSLTLSLSTTYYITARATNGVGLTITTTTSTECSDLGSGLRAFWTFNHASDGGGDFNDSITATSGVTNHMLTGGATVISGGGKVSDHVSFDGSNSLVLDNYDHNDEAHVFWGKFDDEKHYSMSFWVKLNDIDNDYTLISKRKSNSNGFYVGFNSSAKKFYTIVHSESYGTEQVVSNVAADTWYHIVVWYQGNTEDSNPRGISGITINGDPDLTTATQSTHGQYDTPDALFTVGGRQYTSDPANMEGEIDSVGFWHNRVLTSQEIIFLYNGGSGIEP